MNTQGTGLAIRNPNLGQCKAEIGGTRATRQCSRDPLYGGWCQQHHPEEVKGRKAARLKEQKRLMELGRRADRAFNEVARMVDKYTGGDILLRVLAVLNGEA